MPVADVGVGAAAYAEEMRVDYVASLLTDE